MRAKPSFFGDSSACYTLILTRLERGIYTKIQKSSGPLSHSDGRCCK